jgi:hypothetical protein
VIASTATLPQMPQTDLPELVSEGLSVFIRQASEIRRELFLKEALLLTRKLTIFVFFGFFHKPLQKRR